MSALTPLTIVAGYLGAGKTTLINRLLAQPHGKRLAVLVNDFGDINIDASLIASHDGDTISLTNGCVCCSISDALGDALDQVTAMVPPPDQIVVEASGVSDPAKVAHYGLGWPGVTLDSVLTLADAETVQGRATDKFVGHLVQQQLRSADLVVLTKPDLLDEARLREVEQWAASLANGAPLVRATNGDLPAAMVLGDGGTAGPFQARQRNTAMDNSPVHGHFESVSAEFSSPIDREHFCAFADALPPEVWRAKGLLRFSAEPEELWIFHKAGQRWSLSAHESPSAQTSASVLICIGVEGTVDVAAIRARMDQLAVTHPPRN